MRGEIAVWYASDQEQAAWAELFRHFVDVGIDPFEVRRRVGAVEVDGICVLDLVDARVRSELGLSVAALTGDDYTQSQDVAGLADRLGLDGIVAPSAALPGRRTLALFARGLDKATVKLSRIRQPPPRLADFLHAIPSHLDSPQAVRDMLTWLAEAGADRIRRRR